MKIVIGSDFHPSIIWTRSFQKHASFSEENERWYNSGGLPTNATLKNPFGVAVDSIGNIYIQVKSGYRMTAPKDCPPEIFELMLQCWTTEPDNRPTFQMICETIFKIWKKVKPNSYVTSDLQVKIR